MYGIEECYIPLFFSGGSGASGPALPDSLLWHGAYPDETEVVDLVAPAKVTPAKIKGVNVLEFTGTASNFGSTVPFTDYSYTEDCISGWVYMDSTQTQINPVIMTLGTVIGGASAANAIGVTGDNLNVGLVGRIRNSASVLTSTSALSITPNEWTYFVFEWSLSGGYIRITANGETKTLSGLTAADFPSDYFTSSWRVGSNSISGGGLVGRVSQLDICNGSLTLPICEGYNFPKDSSGKGNNATQNTATWIKDTTGQIEGVNQSAGHTPSVVGDGVTSYIDLGIIPDADTEFEVTADWETSERFHGVFAGGRYFFGAAGTGYRFGYGAFNAIGHSEGLGVRTLKISNHKLFIDGIEYLDSGLTSLPSVTESITLCARNSGAGVNSYTPDPTLNAKVWQSGTLVRDMVPLRGGRMLDRVNNVVYSNAGAGNLVTRYSTALSHVVDGATVAMPTKSEATFQGVGGDIITMPQYLVGGQPYDIEVSLDNRNDDFVGHYLVDCGPRIGFPGLAIELSSETITIITRDSLGHTDWATAEYDYLPGEQVVLKVGITGTSALPAISLDDNPLSVSGAVSTWDGASGLSVTVGDGFAGIIRYVNGVGDDYDLTQYTGKSTTNILSASGNNNGVLSVGAGGLDTFWGRRYFDELGSEVDSERYLPIEWVGCVANKVNHNNSEVYWEHTDAQISAYDNIGATGGGFNQVYYEDLKLWLSDAEYSWIKWVEISSNCYPKEVGIYEDGTTFTEAEYNKNVAYWKQGVCGAGHAPFLMISEGGDQLITETGNTIILE